MDKVVTTYQRGRMMKKVQTYDRMYAQALDIISRMKLSPEPSTEGSSMYVFTYKNTTMFLDEGLEDHDIDLLCPIYLSGTEEEQKQLFESAKDMAEEDLVDFDIFYIGEGLAYMSLFLQVKETRHKLYKKHLVAMLDKLFDGYITFMCAISLIQYTQSPEFISSIADNK